MKGNVSAYATILYRINETLIKCEEAFLALATFVLLIAMVIQVVCRYVLMIATPWAEELSRYIYIWIAYIGGAYATFYWDHIEIDLMHTLTKKFSKNPERFLMILNKVAIALSMGFIAIFINIYGNFLFRIWSLGQYSAAMGINMVIPMAAAWAGGILMLVHGVSILILPRSIVKPPFWKQ